MWARSGSLFPSNPSIFEDGHERSTATVRERICSALTVLRDEPPDGHRLHRMWGEAGGAVVSGSRDAEQNYPIVCAQCDRQLFHGLPASLSSPHGAIPSRYAVSRARSSLASYADHLA